MKKTTAKNAMNYVVLLMLTAFGAIKANACNTNSGMYFQDNNQQGTYNFWTWKNSSGQYYKLNMRVTWDFGDGNTGSGQTSHTYASQGRYSITLYLWDTAANCGDTLYGSLCYFHPQVTPVVKRSNDSLYASATCNSNWKYHWIFDDNTYSYDSACSIKHHYTNPGFYKPVLSFVRDTVMGCEDTIIHNFKVMDFTRCGFLSDFKVYSSANMNEKIVSATPFGKYYRPDKPGSVVWKWGDNTSTTLQSIPFFEYFSHVYQNPGTYAICRIVADSAGTCKDSSCLAIVVDSCNALADFTYTITGNYVYLKASATTGSFSWTFGGGSGSSTTSSQPTAYYNGPGTYAVCLETTLNNCKKKECKTITITNCKLLGNYNYSIDTGDCLKVHFTQTTNKTNLIYKWTFGDATSSTAKDPTHTYSNKGWYMVKLWARDTTTTCKDSTYFGVSLLCLDCKIKDSLVLDYDSAYPYQAVLYNYSTGPIHKHFWDFGDSSTSTSASPTHSYSITGRICIMYIATDTIKNCSDTTRFCFTIDTFGNIKRRAFLLNIITPGQTSLIQRYTDLNKILVYPNPFNSELLISGIPSYVTQAPEIIDILGRKVIFSGKQEGDNYRIVFKENTAPGLYILRIKTDKDVAIYKLYKQ